VRAGRTVMGIIVADTRLRLYVSDRLEPAALQVVLAKIAEYTRAGFTGTGATAAGVAKLSMGI